MAKDPDQRYPSASALAGAARAALPDTTSTTGPAEPIQADEVVLTRRAASTTLIPEHPTRWSPDPPPTITATIPVGKSPVGVAVSPDGRRAYITNVRSNTVSVIDTGVG